MLYCIPQHRRLVFFVELWVVVFFLLTDHICEVAEVPPPLEWDWFAKSSPLTSLYAEVHVLIWKLQSSKREQTLGCRWFFSSQRVPYKLLQLLQQQEFTRPSGKMRRPGTDLWKAKVSFTTLCLGTRTEFVFGRIQMQLRAFNSLSCHGSAFSHPSPGRTKCWGRAKSMLPKYITLFRTEGVKHTDRWEHFQKHSGPQPSEGPDIMHRLPSTSLQPQSKLCTRPRQMKRSLRCTTIAMHILSLIFLHFRAPLPVLCFASLLLSHLTQHWQLLFLPSTNLCKTTQPEARQILPGCREKQKSKDDDKLSTSFLTVAEWLYFTWVN